MKERKWKGWQRIVSGLLSVVFLLNICLDSISSVVYAAPNGEVAVPSISLTFEEEPLSGGTMVSRGTYLVSKDSNMVMTARFSPNFTDGYVTGAYIEIRLPYFYSVSYTHLDVYKRQPCMHVDGTCRNCPVKTK